MSKHTPGPWEVMPRYWYQGFFKIHHKQRGKGVSSLMLARVTVRPSWKDEQTANARLIASAPELLEALEAALPYIPKYPKYAPGIESPHQKAVDALKKAKGDLQ